MLKRTRSEAEFIVHNSFSGLSFQENQFLIQKYQDINSDFCSNCKSIGTIYRIINGTIRSNTCMCKIVIDKKKLSKNLLDDSNIPKLYHNCDLKSWQNMGSSVNDINQNHQSYHIIDVYSKSLSRMKLKGHGLFICGPNGVGKTYLACAIGKAATKSGKTVKFYTMSTIIQTTIKGWFNDEAELIVRGISDADFLIIDDLDKIYKTKTGIENALFDNLLRERLQRQRPCIFTSNRTLKQAYQDYGNSIHSMLSEQCAEVIFLGTDHRSNMGVNVKDDILNGGS